VERQAERGEAVRVGVGDRVGAIVGRPRHGERGDLVEPSRRPQRTSEQVQRWNARGETAAAAPAQTGLPVASTVWPWPRATCAASGIAEMGRLKAPPPAPRLGCPMAWENPASPAAALPGARGWTCFHWSYHRTRTMGWISYPRGRRLRPSFQSGLQDLGGPLRWRGASTSSFVSTGWHRRARA
jgi:hypothetical protein